MFCCSIGSATASIISIPSSPFATIYIGNLGSQATEDDLKLVFGEYGTVARVQLPRDRETGGIEGFGFVEMLGEVEEEAAISALDGTEWMGHQLRVNKAKPREDNRRRSRSGRGRL